MHSCEGCPSGQSRSTPDFEDVIVKVQTIYTPRRACREVEGGVDAEGELGFWTVYALGPRCGFQEGAAKAQEPNQASPFPTPLHTHRGLIQSPGLPGCSFKLTVTHSTPNRACSQNQTGRAERPSHKNPRPEWMQCCAQATQKDCTCSVPQWCPTLCDPMDCSTPGFPVHHQLKRCLLLRRKAMANLDSILKSRDITLPTTLLLPAVLISGSSLEL